jgi:putative hydrolase of HD superfamily
LDSRNRYAKALQLKTNQPTNTLPSVLKDLPHRPEPSTTSPIPFFHLLERLKTTPREGWRRFGIDSSSSTPNTTNSHIRGESIGDHMYRMAIITLLCPPSLSSKLDLARCTRMALVHDMAEALVGDITPMDNVEKPEKSRREAETMDYICDSLLGRVGGGMQAKEIKDVWWEYENDETLEAHFVHDVDKMELLLQMVEYERRAEGRLDLGEFSRVAERVVLPEIKDWAAEVLRERREFWAEKGVVPSFAGDVESGKKESQDQYYGAGVGAEGNGKAE